MTQNLFYDLPNDLKQEIQTRAYKMVHKEFLEDFKVNAKNYYNELKRRCVTKRFNELKSRLDVLLDIPLIDHEDFHEFSSLYAEFKQLVDVGSYFRHIEVDVRDMFWYFMRLKGHLDLFDFMLKGGVIHDSDIYKGWEEGFGYYGRDEEAYALLYDKNGKSMYDIGKCLL